MAGSESERRRLFAASLAEFTSVRDQLVRELRTRGEADEAGRIAKLRKPPLALWVANQLGRLASADVEALIQATASVRNAQTGGTQAGELREVMRAQRDALARLLDAAGRVAREAGTSLTLALQRRVQNTVQAAAAGQPQSLKDGLLETELQPSGFEGLLGAEPTRTVRDEKHPLEPDPAADRARKKEAAARAHALQEAQREAGQLGEKAKKLEQHAAALEREAARAREDADEARRKSDEAAALVLELGRLTPRPE